MQNKLSIVVLTHNDESIIVDCLERLNFTNEIIIVDDNSTDRTVELAKRYTDKVYQRSLSGSFSNQRNFALNYVHNPWVLFIDSDELVSDSLEKDVLRGISDVNFAGYYIKRVDSMWGKKILHGEAGEVNLLRLAKKNSGKWHGSVHETWKIIGKKGTLPSVLIHVPHPSMREFINEVDTYSTLRAEELKEAGKSVSFLSIIIYPSVKFLLNFFLKKGFKDGIPGFLYAMTMSFHSFLVRAKLYQMTNR
jgi:glycosyltransferase involved in cell wall biosynthesis